VPPDTSPLLARQPGLTLRSSGSIDPLTPATLLGAGQPTARFTGANSLRPDDGVKGSGNSPDGLLLLVAFDGDRVKGSAMGEAMAHTGTHIADLRESPMGRNLFQLEGRAWGVTVMHAIRSKEKILTLPGGYVAWNSKWSDVDQQKQLPGSLSGYLTQWAALSP